MVAEASAREHTGTTAADPTPRTLESQYREMAALKEIIVTRLDAMDKAVGILQAFADRSPTTSDVDAKVNALKELTEKTFGLNAIALDAALKTQEKATDKIEISFTKQFDANTELMRSQFKATDEKIAALSALITEGAGRLTLSEGRSKGLGDGWGYLVGGAGFILTLGAIAAMFAKGI